MKIVDSALDKTILKVFPGWMTPNHLTISRFIMTPFVLFLLVIDWYEWGTVLFAIAAITDMLDGALARTRDQITEWGKLFDPLADKLLIGSTAVIVIVKFMSAYVALLILVFEAMLVIGAWWQKTHYNKTIQAESTGKAKMVAQSFGLGFLLLFAIYQTPMFFTIGALFIYGSIIMAILSLFVYKSI